MWLTVLLFQHLKNMIPFSSGFYDFRFEIHYHLNWYSPAGNTHFSLVAFKTFFFVFIFQNFNCGVSLAWISLCLSCLVFTQLLGITSLCLLPNLGYFSANTSSNNFSILFYFPSGIVLHE